MSFDVWGIFLILALAALFFFMIRLRKKGTSSKVTYSSVSDLKTQSQSFRQTYSNLPNWLYMASLGLIVLALADPHTFEPKKNIKDHEKRDPTEGRVIMLVLDQSGSMNEPATRDLSKIQLMKPVIDQFVKSRPSDLIGLATFARVVKILDPPTLDHEQVIKDIDQLKTVANLEQDGTAIGYALLKTTHLLVSLKEQAGLMGQQAPYTIKGMAIVLVTDGLQDPSPLDKDNPNRSMGLEEAAAFAKEKNVRLYIVNIEPKFSSSEFLPNLKQMQKIAALTGGKFYHAASADDLSEFIETINSLEISAVRLPENKGALPSVFKKVSYYPELIAGALLLFLSAYLLQGTYFRRVS